MSHNTDHIVSKVNGHEVVVQTRSHRLSLPTSTTTSTYEHRTDVVVTEIIADTAGMLLPEGAATVATYNNETEKTSVLSVTINIADPPNTRQRGRWTDANIDSSRQHETIWRRRLEFGDLMLKTTGQAKPISDEPAEQFRPARRPEITHESHWRIQISPMSFKPYGTDINAIYNALRFGRKQHYQGDWALRF